MECHLLEQRTIAVLKVFCGATRALYVLDCQALRRWRGDWPPSSPAVPGRTGRLQAGARRASPAALRTVCLVHVRRTGELESRRQTSYSPVIQWNSCMITDLAFCFRNEPSFCETRFEMTYYCWRGGSQIFKDENCGWIVQVAQRTICLCCTAGVVCGEWKSQSSKSQVRMGGSLFGLGVVKRLLALRLLGICSELFLWVAGWQWGSHLYFSL